MILPRLLLLSSLPDGTGVIRADRKFREIERRVALAPYGGIFTIRSVPAARREEIAALVRTFRPTHLHITCHGVKDRLILENSRRLQEELELDELRAIVDRPGTVRALVLEACESAEIAEALRTQTRATLGIAGKFGPADTDFGFASFYQALAAGRSLRAAYAEARLDLEIVSRKAARAPRIHANEELLDASLFNVECDPVSLGVVDEGGAVTAIADSLRRGGPDIALACFDRAKECLLERWEQGRGIVHLRGDAGSGRTLLLTEWLADLQKQGWLGARRVFAWSFVAARGDRLSGDVAGFFEALVDFLDEPWLDVKRVSEWELGRVVGRLLRRERCLLVLDGVELLPSTCDVSTLEARLHPGLVALLRGLEEGAPGLCVMTTREDVTFRGSLVGEEVRLSPLTDSDGAAWLWQNGMIEPEGVLVSTSRALAGNPLALAWRAAAESKGIAHARASKSDTSAGPLNRALLGIVDGGGVGERVLLAALALAGGSLSDAALSRIWEVAGAREGVLAALRQLARRGLVKVSRAPRSTEGCWPAVEVSHPRVVEATLVAGLLQELPPDVVERTLEPGPPPLSTSAEIPGLHRHIHGLVMVGRGAVALSRYIERVARYEWGKQWSFIGRGLGRYADDLAILGEFFEEPWSRLLPTVVAAKVEERAYLFHRVGLALRNVGRVAEAVAPLEAAHRLYTESQGGTARERSATCANDIAEVLIAIGRVKDADSWAKRGVDDANLFVKGAGAELRQAHVCRSLLFATRGDVLRRLGDIEGASQCFAEAELDTAAIAKIDGRAAREGFRFLFSRPGHYHWAFLLDQLETAIVGGDEGLSKSIQEELAGRLNEARIWCQGRGVAAVSPCYEYIARGRLNSALLLQAEVDDKDAIVDAAEDYFAEALALLHANHQVWMVPEVLRERAKMRERAGDPLAAAEDREEAERLAGRLGLGGA